MNNLENKCRLLAKEEYLTKKGFTKGGHNTDRFSKIVENEEFGFYLVIEIYTKNSHSNRVNCFSSVEDMSQKFISILQINFNRAEQEIKDYEEWSK